MVKQLKLLKENFFLLAIAFLLFFIPVYPKFPLIAVPGTYVSIRLEDILIALVTGIFLITLFLKKDKSILKENFTKLIFLYFGVGLLSIISAVLITKNIVPHIAVLHFIRRIEYLSLLFIAYFSIKKIGQLRYFAYAIALATVGVIIYALGQKFFGWPVVSTMNKEFSKGMILQLTWWARVNSTFAGHYDLAAYLVMVLALTTAAAIIVKKKAIKLLIVILGVFSYYVLILTASRISFAAYLVTVSAVLILSNKKWYLIPFLILSVLGMVFSEDLGQRYAATFKIDLSFMSGMVKIRRPPTVAVVLPTKTPTPIKETGATTSVGPIEQETPTPTPTPELIATPSAEYFEPTELAVGRSTDIRLKVEWPRALRAFLKNPLLGTGYSSITLATDNDYLRMLGETGILGSLIWLAIVIEIFGQFCFFLKSREADIKDKIIIIGILGAAIGYFVNATFIDVFEASKIAFFFWIMIGAGLKIIDLDKKNNLK